MRDIASPLDGFASPFGPGRRTLTNLLFGTSNATGFTFEPWDITTLYQDRAGTTPVTAVGQSVGKRLDKSGRGNHEVAINDAARGVYGREPKGGTRNRLTYTEQFDNAAWFNGNTTVTANTVAAPDGLTTADTLTFAAIANANLQPTAAISVTTGQQYTYSVYIRAASAVSNVKISMQGSDTAISVTTEWQRVTRTVTASGTTLSPTLVTRDAVATAVYIWGAQLELGASATAYQKVVSQYDVTEAGVPSCYYVQTDGVDDAYVTPTITPGTDKVQVFAGVRKNSDVDGAVFVEHSASINSNAGSFGIYPQGTGTDAAYTFGSRGSALSGANFAIATPYNAPTYNVIACLGDISGDRAALRVNGVQVAQSTADQGTGNYLAYPAHIYARGGTSLPFNGRDYGHAVRFGPNLDAATIARVEALIARNTPEVTL